MHATQEEEEEDLFKQSSGGKIVNGTKLESGYLLLETLSSTI